ncbi:MAG: metallophosphoesterase, partial [Oscillospiraceae bacterium]|nr:metallophosphoesterase [Oscillospiraceae bacterium]
MKFMHLSDLHLGKSLNGFSLLKEKDQEHILQQILHIADEQKPDCVVIAGDVYDRALP